MKSHPWDELNDSSKDFFDANGFVSDTEFNEDVQDKHLQRRRLTELRRRTEERLDWKRVYDDLQFDDVDDERYFRHSDSADDFEDADDLVDD